MSHLEDNNYPKAFLFSSVVMGLLLLICHLIILQQPLKQDDIGVGGIIVNYGTSDSGMGDDFMSIDEPSVDQNANNSLPNKVANNPPPINDHYTETSDKDIASQDLEDAPSVVKKNSSTPNPVSTIKDSKDTKPVINPNALYKGAKNNGQGKGDGSGNTAGNQGSKNGDPLSPNYGEGGSGSGNINLSLANRRFVSIPKVDDQGQSAGKVVVEIRVDKTGEVVFARAGAKGTTLSDLKIWKKCEEAVLGSRLNQLESAPDIQLGIVVFNFRVK